MLLVETMSVKSLDFPNFLCKSAEATKHERGRPTGGITIAVHQRIMNKCDVVSKSDFCISFKLENTPRFFIVAYFNPDIEEDDMLHELSRNLCFSQSTDEIFLFGDFDCRIDKPDEKTNALLEFLHLQHLNCINDAEEKTFVNSQGSSTIELCFTNAGHRVSDWKIINSLLSNHRLLTLSNTGDYKLKEDIGDTIFEINMEVLTSIVEEIDLSLQQSTENLNNLLVNAFSSSKMKKQTSKPWFGCELYVMHKTLKEKYKIHRFEHLHEKRKCYQILKKSFKTMCKRKKAQYEQD